MPIRVLAAVAVVALPLCGGAGEPAVTLTVRPAAAPVPALKYQLLPEVRELQAGNPAQWYVRCFAEQRNFFFSKDGVATRNRALAAPLADLGNAEFAYFVGTNALKQADWGARLDAIDWQVTDRIKGEGLDATFPEMPAYGVLAESLHVRLRIEIHGKKFGDAIVTAKTMLMLARHLGEHPALAANTVGMSIAGRTLDALEEFVQQPGAPNLYWALTDLPTPLVEVRKGLQGHAARVATELAIPDAEAMTAEQVEKVVSRLSGILGFTREQTGESPRSLRADLKALLDDGEHVKAVRKRLHAPGAPGDPLRGLAALPVAAFTPTQAVLWDAKCDYERRRDECLKLLALAPWQMDALPLEKTSGLFGAFLPPVAETRKAQAKIERRLGVLRHVEALRMHQGTLPEMLSELKVPLPTDPFTGKPFAYSRDGAAARVGDYKIVVK